MEQQVPCFHKGSEKTVHVSPISAAEGGMLEPTKRDTGQEDNYF